MNETPKNKSGRRITRRVLVGLAIFATLIAIFYTEEDWRGKRAWENCKRELEAKGAVLDWDKFIPPPVPDDQNFFKAPKMQNWFVRLNKPPTEPYTNEWRALWSNTNIMMAIPNKMVATNYLAWSDQFQSDFDLIREALKRPYARMDGDYSQPFEMPIPNFVAVRALAQVLAQRTKCYLLLRQPEKALDELTLLNDSRHFLERTPTGKPMALVDAMVNVAITGLYVNTIAGGLRKQAWREPQLAALQKQLAGINLAPFVAHAFECEPAAWCAFETTRVRTFLSIPYTRVGASLPSRIKDLRFYLFDLGPHGWVYQNMAAIARLENKQLDSFDSESGTLLPSKVEDLRNEVEKIASHFSPYTFVAPVVVPNTAQAMQTLAYNQTLANEAQIVCALERYHLAHGEYPETLDALAPQFIEKLPHDIIGGQPLHYRRTESGKFLLYSIGWNETDDGGQVALKPDGSEDWGKGDWVWQYPLK